MLILKRIWELISRLLSGRSRVRIAPGPPLKDDDPLINSFRICLIQWGISRIRAEWAAWDLARIARASLPNEPPLDEKTTDSGHQTATERELRLALLTACLRPATREFYVHDGEIQHAKSLGAIYACRFCEQRLRPVGGRPPKWWVGHEAGCVVAPGEALILPAVNDSGQEGGGDE